MMAGGVECASPSTCPALVACSGVRGGTHGRAAVQQASAGGHSDDAAAAAAALLLCSAGRGQEKGKERERKKERDGEV